MCIQSNIFSSLAVLCQFGKKQEPPVTATLLAETNTLNAHCERVQKAACNTTRANGTDCMEPPVCENNERCDDTSGENPTGDVEGDGRFNSTGPTRERQKVDSSECVDTVDCEGDNKKDPKEEV